MKNALARRSSFLTPTLDPDSLFSQMDSLFHDLFAPLTERESSLSLFEQSAYPRLDIRDEPSQFVVDIEVPGLSKEDIKVEVNNNVLIVRGDKRKELEEKQGTYIRRELKRSSFSRQICTLNDNCDVDNISASFKDGMLTVIIPKKALEPPRQDVKQITIK